MGTFNSTSLRVGKPDLIICGSMGQLAREENENAVLVWRRFNLILPRM